MSKVLRFWADSEEDQIRPSTPICDLKCTDPVEKGTVNPFQVKRISSLVSLNRLTKSRLLPWFTDALDHYNPSEGKFRINL